MKIMRIFCAIALSAHLAGLGVLALVAITTSGGCIYVNSGPENAHKALKVPEIKKAFQAKEAIESQTTVVKQLGSELDGLVSQTSYQFPQPSSSDPRTQYISAIRALREPVDVGRTENMTREEAARHRLGYLAAYANGVALHNDRLPFQ